ncbi:MAG TPA: UdgX family uracil-DNA binding protein [Longimicrobiales bacterium]|nr:UdgX family uracil-DNA binding protein [Longimicrobiales bacterium]
MADRESGEERLRRLRQAARQCTACPLWKHATQTVFGEGPADARVLLVGEQPGDQEDRTGHPFVGPAGQLLDRALEAAGVDRQTVFVTNVVKHFKWTLRGKRRLHKKPIQREIDACFQWLEREIETIRPQLIVCLGATAAQALLGHQFRVSRQRGQLVRSELAPYIFATTHPSAILRMTEGEERQQAFRDFVADLKLIGRLLSGDLPSSA